MRNLLYVAIVLVIPSVHSSAADSKSTIQIALRAKGKSQRVELTGLSKTQLQRLAKRKLTNDQWARLFPVRVVSGNAAESVPAMLGRWRIEADRVVFTPQFPFRPGVGYRATFQLNQILAKTFKPLTYHFTIPKPKPARPAVVTHVFPSGPVLPENLLKFYIHFSVPMSRGEAYDRITLVNSSGKTIPEPFLKLEQELWDRSGTRFTLFFAPGRIKRGLRPRAEMGPALEAGKSYTLRIDSRWQTADGDPLARFGGRRRIPPGSPTIAFEQKFRVGPADRKQPDPRHWKIAAAKSGTRSPLVVDLDEPLDHSMLMRVMTVRDAAGNELRGEISVDRHEQRWQFIPVKPWTSGRHVVRVETTLEDRAGNSIGQPFEVRLDTKKRPPAAKFLDLPFQPLR